MTTITDSTHLLLSDMLYAVCSACEATTPIAPCSTTKFIAVTSCNRCSSTWNAQSEELDLSYLYEVLATPPAPIVPSNLEVHLDAGISQFASFAQYSPLSQRASTEVTSYFTSMKNWMYGGEHHGKSFIGTYVRVPSALDAHVALLEDVGILLYAIMRSKSQIDRLVAITSYCKMRGNRMNTIGLLSYCLTNIMFEYRVQQSTQDAFWNKMQSEVTDSMDYTAQDDDENPFSALRGCMNQYENLKETVLFKKLYKFGLYVLTLGLLDGINITFDSCNFSRFEKESIKRTHRPGVTMVHVMLDTALFVAERGYQYFKTGDIHTILHTGSAYEGWVVQAQKLIHSAPFLSNPEPHGINKFTFLSELKDTIEKGKGIVKFTAKLEKTEKLFLGRLLNDLLLIESNELTKREAQKPRKDPLGILIHGGSSICKSQLVRIIYYHHGMYFDLPTGSEYVYTRSPTDQYWSGYNSTQWCIVMDDIAFLKPNGVLDPTVSEMLLVKNNTPYCPPQAELADKGRTPVRAELLIGTTNTEHLNLDAQFACPFAIARRFSYIITAVIKPEFSKNVIMADSSKIPITAEGDYMNIWNFIIKVPLPATDQQVDNQKAKYAVVHEFDNIHDMLGWYITIAKQHEESQKKALAADKVMGAVSVCHECGRAVIACTCHHAQDDNEEVVAEAVEEVEQELPAFVSQRPMSQIKFWIYAQIIQHAINPIWREEDIVVYLMSYPQYFQVWASLLLLWTFPRTLLSLFLGIAFFKYFWVMCAYGFQAKNGSLWKIKLAYKLFSNEAEAYRFIFRLAGMRVKKSMTSSMLKKLAAVLSAAIVAYGIKEAIFPTKYSKQGNTGTIPTSLTEEKPVYYYHDPYKVTDMEISSQSKCALEGTVENIVKANSCMFTFRWLENEGKANNTMASNVHGTVYMFNKHSIRGSVGTLDVTFDPISQNISRNVRRISVSQHDIRTIKDSDVAFIDIKAIAPGRSLLKFFPVDKPIKGVHKGDYHLISKDGDRCVKPVVAIRATNSVPVYHCAGYLGNVCEPTKVGNCGALCISTIAGGQVVLGMHSAGNDKAGVVILHVSQRVINTALASFDAQVSQGTVFIDAPGYARRVTELHPKSTLRFVPQGTATVMGSFEGFRPKHKTKVTKTLICDEVVAGGYVADYKGPCMTWQPWDLAIRDMTNPVHTFDNQVLRDCSLAFTNDILSSLTKDDLSMLEVYTQDVALNGVDGITYVDKLNTNTSAGNPFKQSKKKFIEFDDQGKILKLDTVIQDRIDLITTTYEKSTRFHPQFCGHLKDEPTPNRKVIAGKTRVFTGGEFAWSVVVRRFYLSHIRLIQNNPFVFEAMPGIVAQSHEWTQLYDYLTKFGEAKVVAGDYGKFDKKMAAPFILEAFNILIRLSEAAGWSQEDLSVLRCIAYDTAFPTIDFNGDLIEVQGNPSGHPLTVIINCLVNSLYMRYAYKLVAGSPADFRKHVNLATYGDDNIMSVSDSCPGFNHTRIATALKAIGVEYTMAEKEAVSVPYIHIKDASFLKRKFVWNAEVGARLAPLPKETFDKMLTSRLDTGNIAAEAHSICVIETAVREYFFYGRPVFESRREYLIGVAHNCGLDLWLTESTFPTFDQLAADFWSRGFPPHIAQKAQELKQKFLGNVARAATPFGEGLTSPAVYT